MKNYEIPTLAENINKVIDHVKETKNKNFNLNYGLTKNSKRIQTALKEIESNIPAELKDLENKVWVAAKEEAEKNNQEVNFELGLSALTEEENKSRLELLANFNEFLNYENELDIYYFDAENSIDFNLDIEFVDLLTDFIR